MAQSGSLCESSDKLLHLKRKRDSSDEEDLEGVPPTKILAKTKEVENEVIVESSTCSSCDEGESHYENIESQPTQSAFTDSEYGTGDSLLSPPSISELSNYVLSPLENVNRTENTPHSSRWTRPRVRVPFNSERRCPLPGLSWAESSVVWKRMIDADAKLTIKRHPLMFDNHPCLEHRMRAILLDWLNEVAEVYKLHRETFHTTVDFFDRYMSTVDNVPKGRLQLIGITCLFMAAKLEEVYPPKLSEFAYVTDGACTVEEMLLEERHIALTLRWKLSSFTCNRWLNIYIQLASDARNAKNRMISERDVVANSLRAYTFIFPQYSSLDFVICGQLLDLAVLHVDINNYSYSVVAAAAIAHTFNKALAVRVSGYDWEVISPCYEWLQPFVTVLHAEGAVSAVRVGDGDFMRGSGGLALLCPDINTDESHRLHVHNVTLDMFDKVCHLMEEQRVTTTVLTQVDTPSTSKIKKKVFPTPPQSDQKDPDLQNPETPSTSMKSPNPEPSFRPDIQLTTRISEPEVYRSNLEIK